ncbi:MAG: hypothetical protein ACE5RN_01190 [Nitrosopumilaceae archaeon]
MNDDEHKKLVKGIIDHFEAKGLKIISAAYDGFKKCEIIGNHEPDVIAKKPNEDDYYIGEAKTCEKLTNERTREQFEDFGNTVRLTEGATRNYLPFCIAVPEKCIDELKSYLTEIGLGMNENIEMISF